MGREETARRPGKLGHPPKAGPDVKDRNKAKNGTLETSVPIKLIFFSKSAFLLGTRRFIFNFAIVKHLLGTRRFIFNFAIVKHAKAADFLGTRWHTIILVGILLETRRGSKDGQLKRCAKSSQGSKDGQLKRWARSTQGSKDGQSKRLRDRLTDDVYMRCMRNSCILSWINNKTEGCDRGIEQEIFIPLTSSCLWHQ